MVNLILCGGSGTRLWPLSRKGLPKQFVKLFGDRSLFQEAVLRNRPLCTRTLIAANSSQIPIAEAQLKSLGIDSIEGLSEPIGRNTAPAIALAVMALPRDEIVLITPSDHRMTNLDNYGRSVHRAMELAKEGYLVTFGITPQYAETGYGYIEADGENVLSFREKPAKETAEAYVNSGKYYWNSGMFVFTAGVFLDELLKLAPELYSAVCNTYAATPSGSLLEPSLEAMLRIPAISIDYAVMEKSHLVKVVKSNPGWSDLGSFDALYDEVTAGEDENAVLAMNSILRNAKGCLVVGKIKPVVLDGVEDLIVIDTETALLVMKRGESQKVKDIFQEIKEKYPELL
jgi:mannose-1-phosphate guanylyltransferase